MVRRKIEKGTQRGRKKTIKEILIILGKEEDLQERNERKSAIEDKKEKKIKQETESRKE